MSDSHISMQGNAILEDKRQHKFYIEKKFPCYVRRVMTKIWASTNIPDFSVQQSSKKFSTLDIFLIHPLYTTWVIRESPSTNN